MQTKNHIHRNSRSNYFDIKILQFVYSKYWRCAVPKRGRFKDYRLRGRVSRWAKSLPKRYTDDLDFLFCNCPS